MAQPDDHHVIDEEVRLAIYRSFAGSGRCMSRRTIAETIGISIADVDGAFERLATERHIALDGEGRVAMAHPFASVPLGFSVMGEDTLWWGGCAWDSFAIPNLVAMDDDVLVATRCPACDRPLAWVVDNQGPPEGDGVAHFLVPMSQAWDDVVLTCSNQRIFCTESCVGLWLDDTGNERGYVMDLATLWRLSSRWYAGRLDFGYTRRDPESSAEPKSSPSKSRPQCPFQSRN